MSNIHILMSSNSVKNTTFSCDDLGIRYEVSKQDGVITVNRRNSSDSTNTIVGEIQYPLLSRERIMLGEHMVQEGKWHDVRNVLVKCGGVSTARSFEGRHGKKYRWESPWGTLVVCSSILVH